MDLFCKECGLAFSGAGNFCSKCGAPSGGTPTTANPVGSLPQSPIEALGIHLPHATIKISETLSDPDFDIKNHYSPEEIGAFYEVLDQILDVSEVHGSEHVLPALNQLGEAGSSAAWRVLAQFAAQNGDIESVRRNVWLAVHCAFNNWDVLVAANIHATELAREINAEKSDSTWAFQSPHPLSQDVAQVSAGLLDVISALYPDSEELRAYMVEGAENTRQMLAEAGVALYNIHQIFGTDGKAPGHVGLMALGLTLLIDFGPVEQRARVEDTLKNLVTIQGQFADFARQLLEIEIIKPKLVELGVWRWS